MNKMNKKRMTLSMTISIVAVLITTIGVLACSKLIYERFYGLSTDVTKEVNTQAGIEISKSIDNYIASMLQISDTVVDILSNRPIQDKGESLGFLLYGDIDTIAVFDNDGNVIIKTDNRNYKAHLNVSAQPWFMATKLGQDKYTLSDAHVQQLYDGEYPWVISLSRSIKWLDQDKKKHDGILLVDLNFKELMERCSKQSEFFGYSFILTAKGDVVYHPYQQLIYLQVPYDEISPADLVSLPAGESTVSRKNNDYYIQINALKNADWRVYSVSKKVGLFSYGTKIVYDIIVVILLVIASAMILAFCISGIITRPLRKLMSSMKRVRDGEIRTVSDIEGFSEVTDLSLTFNEMMRQIHVLMEQHVREQQELQKSELKALHAQINPHFLYNTLDSVVWMAHSGEQEQVVEMVTALADFFRLGLSKGSEMIPLQDELKHIENYLVIQNFRYDGNFAYQIDADPNTLPLSMPNIVLQPIVENAILHGVGNLPSGGRITIKAYLQGTDLMLEVTDNGFGMPPEKCADILRAENSSGSGVGIKNVHQRIQILFGKEYGLRYESELDEGTTVYIRLPVIDHYGEGGTDEEKQT